MSGDVENLTLQLLREIRADVKDIKVELGEVKRVQAEHSMILREHGAAIGGLLDIMHAIHSRVSRIEKHIDLQPA